MTTRLRLRKHNRDPEVISKRPLIALIGLTCATCVYWEGRATGRYRVCRCPHADNFNKPVFHTYYCSEHRR